MIRRTCDRCGAEMDIQKDYPKIYFNLGILEKDLCENCYVEWDRHKTKILQKYADQISTLEKQERKEILDFFGGDTNE